MERLAGAESMSPCFPSFSSAPRLYSTLLYSTRAHFYIKTAERRWRCRRRHCCRLDFPGGLTLILVPSSRVTSHTHTHSPFAFSSSVCMCVCVRAFVSRGRWKQRKRNRKTLVIISNIQSSSLFLSLAPSFSYSPRVYIHKLIYIHCINVCLLSSSSPSSSVLLLYFLVLPILHQFLSKLQLPPFNVCLLYSADDEPVAFFICWWAALFWFRPFPLLFSFTAEKDTHPRTIKENHLSFSPRFISLFLCWMSLIFFFFLRM